MRRWWQHQQRAGAHLAREELVSQKQHLTAKEQAALLSTERSTRQTGLRRGKPQALPSHPGCAAEHRVPLFSGDIRPQSPLRSEGKPKPTKQHTTHDMKKRAWMASMAEAEMQAMRKQEESVDEPGPPGQARAEDEHTQQLVARNKVRKMTSCTTTA